SALSTTIFTASASSHHSPLSLPDALPIFSRVSWARSWAPSQSRRRQALRSIALPRATGPFTSSTRLPILVIGPSLGTRPASPRRSEEHTSELQSRGHLVCRLLLEKKQMQQ